MFIKNKNIKILLNYGLSPLLFIWLSYSIYEQIKNQPNLHGALHSLRLSVTGTQSWKIYLALLLVPINWGLEARKWQILLKPVETIGFFNSFKAILAGLAFSMNTPNRIGEYAGRVLYVHEGNRWKALSLTVTGSFSQLIVTLTIGAGGLLFLLTNSATATGIVHYYIWIRVLFYGTLVVIIFLFLLYFRLGQIIKWAEKIPAARSFIQHLTVIEDLPVTILLRTMSLSFARYIIFAFK